MNFSEKLCKIRELEDLSLQEISNVSGIPYSTMRKYSAGLFSPTLPQIEKILSAPRLARYRSFLLDLDDPIGDDAYLLNLLRKAEANGKGEQARAFLRFLADEADNT